MSKYWLGAVAYDPKVVSIWEGMTAYFREEAKLDLETVLFLSYEAQVQALLSDRIDIAWNTNLAYLQSEAWSDQRCKPLGMRDTDRGWRTVLIAPAGGSIRSLADLKGKKLALGSRDSGHAAILPTHFLESEGLHEGKDYESLRFNVDVGKHGDTGTSELDVLRAVVSGEADVGAVGSPFWQGALDKKLAPTGSLAAIWESPSYSHCMFTARVGLEAEKAEAFQQALFAMKFENEKHRPILEAEGLKEWLPATDEGYASLRQAAKTQGFFNKKGLLR